MDRRPSSVLEQAEALKNAFSRKAAERKLDLLAGLEASQQTGVRAVSRLHELLCYWRAYPDNAEVLQRVEGMLESFHRRPDLRRQRRALADSGIAGTFLDFRFYWLTALWLRRKGWDRELTVNWPDFGHKSKLVEILHLLMPYTETIALDAHAFSPRAWIEELKGPTETDAAFLIRRFETMSNPASREYLYETLDIPMRLALGESTTARGRERWAPAPVVFQTRPPVRARPSLRRVVRESEFDVRALDRRRGQELIDLANGAMVTRHRDLLIFLYADPGDVRLIDFGDGLQFACMGARPRRRLMLESVYGFLTLRNGVPIGYVLCSALFGSSEVAYNVFPTFRSAEAARIYGRVLAMVHRLFGSDCFTIDPYQLGYGNREGLQSGAWWFYYKMGFRPDDPEIRALARKETRKVKASRSYRTGVDTLGRLASQNLFFSLGRKRPDVMGRLPLDRIGLRVTRYLAERFGASREAGLRRCSREAAERLGVRRRKLSGGELLAWKRWSPLVMVLPGLERWTGADRIALFEVIRAKGGRRETDFVRRFDAHRKLRGALLELAEED